MKAKERLGRTYLSLFILATLYICVYSCSSMTRMEWLGWLIQLSALALVWVLCRCAPFFSDLVADPKITFTPKTLLATLPWLAPFLSLVIGTSYLTNLAGEALGYDGAFDFGENVWLCLIGSALLPALVEEGFCRYLFMRRLTHFSTPGAILASALFFTLLHGNFVQMPYAFLAGAFLGALAVGSGSVLPCVVFHLATNTLSALLHFYGGSTFARLFPYLLAGATLVSILWLLLDRRRYIPAFRRILGGEDAGEILTCGQVVGGMMASPCIMLFLVFILAAIGRGV